jgi:hypothetical protein
MLHLRPHNRFEDLDGLYLVGGGTHPGSGLPVIFESARISSKLLLEDFGMNSGGPEAPQKRDVTIASRIGEAVNDAVRVFSGLLALKPAPTVNEGAKESPCEP